MLHNHKISIRLQNLSGAGAIGLTGVFTTTFTATVLPVLPAELAVAAAGIAASNGLFPVWQSWIVAAAGSWLGTMILYTVGCFLPVQAWLERYGSYARIQQEDIGASRQWLCKHARWASAAGQMIPGVRFAAALVAAPAGIPFPTFAAFAGIGILAWTAVFTGVGYFAGDLEFIGEVYGKLVLAVTVLLAAAAVRFLWRRFIKK